MAFHWTSTGLPWPISQVGLGFATSPGTAESMPGMASGGFGVCVQKKLVPIEVDVEYKAADGEEDSSLGFDFDGDGLVTGVDDDSLAEKNGILSDLKDTVLAIDGMSLEEWGDGHGEDRVLKVKVERLIAPSVTIHCGSAFAAIFLSYPALFECENCSADEAKVSPWQINDEEMSIECKRCGNTLTKGDRIVECTNCQEYELCSSCQPCHLADGFEEGDTFGCGLAPIGGSLYELRVTRNGSLVGPKQTVEIAAGTRLHPAVGMGPYEAAVTVNLGESPFMYGELSSTAEAAGSGGTDKPNASAATTVGSSACMTELEWALMHLWLLCSLPVGGDASEPNAPLQSEDEQLNAPLQGEDEYDGFYRICPTCPVGHEMEPFEGQTPPGYSSTVCDECSRSPLERTCRSFFHCSDCRYDICYRCGVKRVAAAKGEDAESVLSGLEGDDQFGMADEFGNLPLDDPGPGATMRQMAKAMEFSRTGRIVRNASEAIIGNAGIYKSSYLLSHYTPEAKQIIEGCEGSSQTDLAPAFAQIKERKCAFLSTPSSCAPHALRGARPFSQQAPKRLPWRDGRPFLSSTALTLAIPLSLFAQVRALPAIVCQRYDGGDFGAPSR